MKRKIKSFSKSIKTATIIGWIRFSNFVKEHKLMASFIGLFVVSGIIALVVFATGDDIARVNVGINSVKVYDNSTTGEQTSIESFSTIKYDVTYPVPTASDTPTQLIISAVFSNCDDCYWVNLAGDDRYGTDSSSLATESYTELVASDNPNNEETATFYLKVGNVEKDTNIKVEFNGGNGVTTDSTSTITVTNSKSSSPQSLSLQLIDGTSYKDALCINGRCASFGVALGVEGSGTNSPDLKGMYFDPDQSVYLEAYNGLKGSEDTSIPLLTDNRYFGLYDSSTNKISGMPNYKESSSQNPYVYDSGSITSFTENPFSSSVIKTSSKSYTLLGSDDITLAVGDEYVDAGLADSKDSPAFCKIGLTPNNCTISILKNGTVIDNTIDTATSGTKYRIDYNITDSNNVRTVLRRNITVGDTPEDVSTDKSTSVVEVSNASVFVNKTDTSLIAKVGGNDVVCDGAQHDGVTCEVLGLDISKVGNQNVTYTVTDANSFVTTLPSTIHVGYMYELKVKDFKTGPKYYSYTDASNNKFVAFGSYYVTANSNLGDNVYAKLTSPGVTSGSVLSPTVSYGTKSETLSFLNLDDESVLAQDDYLAYGEEVIIDSKFKYSSDADNALTSLSVTIPLTNQFSLENYSEEATDNFYYVDAPTNAVISATTNADKTVVTYTLESGQINPGDTIDFRIKVKVNTVNSGSSASITPTVACSNTENLSVGGASINITTFKARLKMYVDEKSTEDENIQKSEVLIDGANKTSSTVTMYPSLSLPAEEIETNAVGISSVNVTIVVSLPKGINYVYNDDYLKPSNVLKGSNGVTTITYNLKDKSMNTWIDAINFDISYDVSLETGKTYDINSVISAASGTISDVSPESLRTATAIINYINTEGISYGEYTAHSAIAQNTSFTITDKLYNHSSSTASGLSIITVLPSEGYTGTYTIEPESSAMCTKDTNITKDNLSGLSWVSCTSLNNDYSGVTAIKTPSISLATNAESDHSFKITPSNNKTGDEYTIQSYLIGVEDTPKAFPITTVSVVSKRITGYVWEDFDANGINDTGEKSVVDVTLSLYKTSDNSLVDTTTSGTDGKYEFANLSEGTYYIVPTFNTSKYGLSPENTTDDQKATSSFRSQQRNDANVISTDDLVVDADTRTISNINLGLSLRQIYTVKVTKYVTKAVVTNALGVSSTTDFGNVTLAKLNVRDPSNVSIKVVYIIELENTGYYPGYVYDVKDYIPDGMTFNKNYVENKDWLQNSNGYLENKSLANALINAGDKKYLTIAFDISRKEAGSFVNSVSVDDEDLQILTVAANGGNK